MQPSSFCAPPTGSSPISRMPVVHFPSDELLFNGAGGAAAGVTTGVATTGVVETGTSAAVGAAISLLIKNKVLDFSISEEADDLDD